MGGCVSAPRAVKYDQEPPEELPKAEETKAGTMNDVEKEEEKEEYGEGLVMPQSLEDSHDKGRVFLAVRTEAEIISAIKMEADAERIPKNIAHAMEELYYNYKNAVLQSELPNADKFILSVMKVVLDRIINDVEEPFVFSPYHKSIREPFDYYSFFLNYFRPLIDFKSSYVGNISLFHEIEQKLQKGENIILASNHQTEADPAIIELLLEKVLPNLGKKMICVAGDRVITDPLCKPFSKGRNLLCVYSKKHINDVPELVEMKKRANRESLKEMGMLLKEGSKIIWIAPSGGRDRPDPVTKELYPAHFDVSAVENMRRLIEHVGVIGHIYPLAMLCYDIMPPPSQVEKEIGERREINFHGTGISLCPEINFHENSADFEDPEEAKKAYTYALYNSVKEQYSVLQRAVHGKEGLEASVQSVSLSQPWFNLYL